MNTKKNTVKYTVKILSDWHTNSGLSAGAAANDLISKDKEKLPFIPGKTIKGLFRDALKEIMEVQPERCSQADIDRLLGEEKEDIENNEKDSKDGKEDFGTESFFSNAVLNANEYKEITSNKLQSYLYRNITSTAMDEKGVVKGKSLRTMEVCIPLTLEGKITGVFEDDIKLLNMAMKWIRRLGSKRNRGFGRCVFEEKNKRL